MSENVKEIIGSVFSVAVKIVLAVIVVMFIYKYTIVAYNYGYRVFTEPPISMGEGRAVTVSIGEDNSVWEIGKMLENKGLIRDGKLFFVQELTSENHGKIQPGKYELSTDMTAYEMVDVMAHAEKGPTTEEELLYNEDENPVNSEVEGLLNEDTESFEEDDESPVEE